MMLRLPGLLACLLWACVSQAAIEELSFDTEAQHARYQQLVAELRCPKCLNANLAGSDAPIAADLRAEVYDQIMAGNSDEEIIAFMTDRYGDFILYRPPLKTGTVLLWFGPPLLLLAGFVVVRRMVTSRSAALEVSELSADEAARLDSLLEADSGQDKDPA